MTCDEAEPLLNAYLDSELTLTECAAVQRHMGECAACATHYDNLAALRNEIASSELKFAVPGALENKLRRRNTMPFAVGIAMAAALAAIAIILPLRLRAPELRAEVLENHARSLLASHLVDVPTSDRHTVKPWFQGKSDIAPFVPDLTAEGFALVGGRLDVMEGRRTPAIVYMRGKHIINVFELASARRPSRPVSAQVNGFSVVHWISGGIEYWAVSDVNEADLRRLAGLISSAPEVN